jgi:hypothetical protein
VAGDIERLDRIIRETLPELDADGPNYGPFHYRYASGRGGGRLSGVGRRADDLLREAGLLPAPGAVR